MTQRTRDVYEDDDIRITHSKRNGIHRPEKYVIHIKDNNDHFDLSPRELFNVADALGTLCDEISNHTQTEANV